MPKLFVAMIGLISSIMLLLACGEMPFQPRKDRGAATPQELVDLYTKAHQKQNLTELGKLLAEYLLGPLPPRGRPDEVYYMEIMKFPLEMAEYESFPPPGPMGNQVDYQFDPGVYPQTSVDSFVGDACGRIIFVKNRSPNNSALSDVERFDPGFVVLNIDGRYYIETTPLILREASHAVKNGTKPRYTPGPGKPIP